MDIVTAQETDPDLHRHRCEVRAWIAARVVRDAPWLREHLGRIEKLRGAAAANQLRIDIAEQWQRGNRGTWGEWR